MVVLLNVCPMATLNPTVVTGTLIKGNSSIEDPNSNINLVEVVTHTTVFRNKRLALHFMVC